MIGKIKGKLSEIVNNVGLIDTTGGVSYEVYLTPRFLSDHKIDQEVLVYTYLQVREDAHVLFGFDNRDELNFFKLLLTVSGVGPKTAFLVVSFKKAEETMAAVKNNDINFFSGMSGLGKKTAMKIILELSQKLKQEFTLEKMYLSDEDKTVVDAFVSLGFKSQEAKKMLSSIPKTLSVEDKIKKGLQLASNPVKNKV